MDIAANNAMATTSNGVFVATNAATGLGCSMMQRDQSNLRQSSGSQLLTNMYASQQ